MLSYCSNVVAAENMSALEQRLATVFAPARELAGVETLGVGLWLPARTMAGLADDPAARRRLAAILAHHGLAVVTMNAFPYGSFHGTSVKHAVYRPDWTTPERIAYTRCCAEVLSELLGDTDHGTISTLPLGWAEQWSDESEAAALRNLSALGDELRQIEEHTGAGSGWLSNQSRAASSDLVGPQSSGLAAGPPIPGSVLGHLPPGRDARDPGRGSERAGRNRSRGGKDPGIQRNPD